MQAITVNQVCQAVCDAFQKRNSLRRWVQIWIDDCKEFRRWERNELIRKEPAPETVSEHARKSQLFILRGRLLQGLMSSPGSPARDLQDKLDGEVRQLETTWKTIHNLGSGHEAGAVLQKAFPD